MPAARSGPSPYASEAIHRRSLLIPAWAPSSFGIRLDSGVAAALLDDNGAAITRGPSGLPA